MNWELISAVIFYSVLGLVVYKNRKKFDFEAKFIAMYRTKVGLKLMSWLGRKHPKTVQAIGLLGVGVGYTGMILAIYTIIDGLYKLVFVPEAPATFAPVIPGVRIPGVEIYVPFWYGIIALFIVVVIHEFSHGVMAEAYKLRVKNTGFVMFGPLPGAFVEPDEKQLKKASVRAQVSVFAAGPFSNILLTFILVFAFGFTPLITLGIDQTYNTQWTTPGLVAFNDKVSIYNYATFAAERAVPRGLIIDTQPGLPAALAGIPNETIITSINGISGEDNFTTFLLAIGNLEPREQVTLTNDTHFWTFTTTTHPENESKGYLGVYITEYAGKPNQPFIDKLGIWYHFHLIFMQQLTWIILLSLGIGLANLLPLGPVDGGRMYLTALEGFLPKKKAKKIWGTTAKLVLAAIIILILVPIFKNILGF